MERILGDNDWIKFPSCNSECVTLTIQEIFYQEDINKTILNAAKVKYEKKRNRTARIRGKRT